MSAAPSITGALTRLPDIAKSGQLTCSKTGHFYLLLTPRIECRGYAKTGGFAAEMTRATPLGLMIKFSLASENNK